MLSDGEMSYLYDGFGRLEQVTKADGSFQKNHYNAEGLRAEMEENGQLVKFLYNENREAVAELHNDILKGKFIMAGIEFIVPLSKVEKYKLKKKLNDNKEIFITDIIGEDLSIDL